MRRTAAALVLFSATTLACGAVGPRSLRYGRGTYNAAIQQTNIEQLLLNLVRLRYRDAPLFLEVTSISSSLSLELGAGLGGTIAPPNSSVAPGSAVSYIERPTITYAPLQGSRFGTQFLSPVELSDILLLYHAGWAIDRIFRVFVQKLGPLQNAPRASGPTPHNAPEFEAFFAATELMRSLWADGLVDLTYLPSVAGNGLTLTLTRRGDDTDTRVARLCALLGLPGPTYKITLTEAPRPGEVGAVQLVPRSLLGGMYYVSHGVEVPPEDYAVGRVPTTRDDAGEVFDWARLTGTLMRVRHGAREPKNAYVSVYYRGLWFWIADNDLDSKSTFSFIAQVLELQSGEIKGTAPVLTLPIAAE
ncbi:hypothetical protein SAMN02745121_05535 [Nannocystis exedens]|uniref:Uncharacterized protein n=1 Tax=Nannocystis exedens TaxID=54 RepID=A0A1I2DDJ4_9BACT|nr:hypothetical protein [Nannocystis exedens]PCC70580.1 hypothetical protein NAEX_03644 [Nannocystis exedens]SFE78461.1 hypothetical protein SAMN02745121_05535 [Nannocystis exedens]